MTEELTDDNKCFKGWQVIDGNTSGRCCCNCAYQKPIVARIKPFSGRYRSLGWGCTPPESPSTTLFEFEHSMCEMHDWRAPPN